MASTASAAEVAAARAYDDLHVPALFAQWAPRLLDAAGAGPGDRVLDVACGTGIVARTALERVGTGGAVSGVDPQPGMLAVAADHTPSVDWQQGVAETLPCDDATFDAVVSQFGIMFFLDRAQSVREMLRVVRPGGGVAVAAWDALERSDAYPEAVDLLARRAGEAAADALRAPFVLGDANALEALLREAGGEDVAVERHVGTARFPSLRVMVEADLRGWLPVMGVTLEEPLIQDILAEAESVLARYVQPSGEMVFDAPALIASARRPAAD